MTEMPNEEQEHDAGLHNGRQLWNAGFCRLCREELEARSRHADQMHDGRAVKEAVSIAQAVAHHGMTSQQILQVGVEHRLIAVGEDPRREGLLRTPERATRAWFDMLSGYRQKPETLVTTFSKEHYDEMVCVGPVSFFSMCEHHLLPFFGVAWVAYVPNETIIGLSKIPRLVELYARRLQNQERLTHQIANELMSLLTPKGAACLVRAQHTCMMARGVKQQSAYMTTNTLLGCFREAAPRAEFLSFTQKDTP